MGPQYRKLFLIYPEIFDLMQCNPDIFNLEIRQTHLLNILHVRFISVYEIDR